jgi:hypothetical protein
MGDYNDFAEIAEAVPTDEPLLVTALDLRDADGAKRLGANVRERIASQLEGHGIGFFPGKELPDWQYDEVYLYRVDSPLGMIVRAITKPTERGIKALTAAAARSDGNATLDYDRLDEAVTALTDAQTLLSEVLGRCDPPNR